MAVLCKNNFDTKCALAIYFFRDWPVDIKPFPQVLSVQDNGLGTLRTLFTRTGHGGRKGEGAELFDGKGAKYFHKLGSCHRENGESRLIKYLLFSKKILSGCRLQAGGEVVLKEIPFPMWPGPGVIYRSDYHHWQGRGWESWIKYTRPGHTEPPQHQKYSVPSFLEAVPRPSVS